MYVYDISFAYSWNHRSVSFNHLCLSYALHMLNTKNPTELINCIITLHNYSVSLARLTASDRVSACDSHAAKHAALEWTPRPQPLPDQSQRGCFSTSLPPQRSANQDGAPQTRFKWVKGELRTFTFLSQNQNKQTVTYTPTDGNYKRLKM